MRKDGPETTHFTENDDMFECVEYGICHFWETVYVMPCVMIPKSGNSTRRSLPASQTTLERPYILYIAYSFDLKDISWKISHHLKSW